MTSILDTLDQYADDLCPMPMFPVEKPDNKRHLTEINRQATFISLMKQFAPTVMVFAIPNAGKRNPRLAKKEGIVAGIFDLACVFDGGMCWVEFKGYRPSGGYGKLSPAQVQWGNDMHKRGHKVAMFFSACSAVDWLVSLGAVSKSKGTLGGENRKADILPDR